MKDPTSLTPLYARYLSVREKRSLRQVPFDDTASEINLLRVLNSLLLKFQQSAPTDLCSRMQALRTCVILNEQLALLVRAHAQALGPRSSVDAFFEEVLASLSPDDLEPVLVEKEPYAP
jgi:hypothetical protein